MFQRKINEIFKGLSNIFDIDNDIAIVGFDADNRNHNRSKKEVMQICHKENFKLNKNKCYFKCTKIPFSEEVMSTEEIQQNLKKLHASTEMPVY